MSTENLNAPTSVLQDICENGTLPRCKEVVEQNNVVMLRDGTLSFTEKSDEKITKLRRRRKQLVLGLSGFDQHQLEEANEIISSARDSAGERLSDFFRRRKV